MTPTQAFYKLHEAHDVVCGGVSEDLDVVCVDESLKHIEHWSLGLAYMETESHGKALLNYQLTAILSDEQKLLFTHGVFSQQVVFGVSLAAVNSPQSAEQRPPPGQDLRGTHLHQLSDGCHHLRGDHLVGAGR